MLADTATDPDSRAGPATDVGETSEAGACAPGVEVSEQIVVVTVTAVVDVRTTVALPGQFVASVAHLVTVYVDVVRTTVVVTSLRAR